MRGQEAEMLYADERHTENCWSNALHDTAENLGDVCDGQEVTPAYLRAVALSSKAEGTSSCVCDLDDPFYIANPQYAPTVCSIEDAAKGLGFAYDLLDAEASS